MLTLVALHPEPNPIIDLCVGFTVAAPHVQADLDNIVAGLARHHGNAQAIVIMAEAFAAMFARRAHASGHPIAFRYALEVELERAMENFK